MSRLSKVCLSGRVITVLVGMIVFGGALLLVPSFESAEARTMPLVIGVPTAVMAIAIFVREVRAALREPERHAAPCDSTERAEGGSAVTTESTSARLAWKTAGLLAASVLLLGHQIGMTIFLLVSQWLIFRLSLVRTLITTVIVMAVFGWFWVHVLHLPVYGGLFGIPVL